MFQAAGHPPLLYWDSQAQQVEFIESNGLLFGFVDDVDYPVHTFSFSKGDRFLLYTDGLTEAENAAGKLFDENHLSKFVQSHADSPPAQLGSQLLQKLKAWQEPSTEQQDDLTWIVIDIE
ncbi:MAG: PP2C family protein-serine/threonine phosphatase [candidate division KSB1 bacterium]|nr:PP2C family protein-serine/threonine phosphatase [candidate division KSB1 bacterium]